MVDACILDIYTAAGAVVVIIIDLLAWLHDHLN